VAVQGTLLATLHFFSIIGLFLGYYSIEERYG
jgi:hypothetical protein